MMLPTQRTSSPAPAPTAARPSSLTQAGTRPSGSCPECGSGRVTSLGMTLTDGTPVQFASCHECEHRHWSHEGQALPLTDVLTKATKQKV
jgi:hypothetical protein